MVIFFFLGIRPGRLEVQVEISLPDENGRLQILQIHTNKMKESSFLSPDVNLQELGISFAHCPFTLSINLVSYFWFPFYEVSDSNLKSLFYTLHSCKFVSPSWIQNCIL